MNRLLSFVVRATALSGKEAAEIMRQPRLILTLVLGPFLILLLFGVSYTEEAAPRRALIVVGQDNPMRSEVPGFAEDIGSQLIYEGMTDDEAMALRRLKAGAVDLVVVVPDRPYETVRSNQHATFTIIHNEINPVQADFIRRMGNSYVGDVNRRVQETIAQEEQSQAAALRGDVTDARDLAGVVSRGVQTGPVAERARELSQKMDVLGQRMDDLQRVDPEIIVEPFRTEMKSIAEVSPSLADYFAPAVLALLLQHLAVTFAGLSIVRDRRQGTMELFRVSPLSAIETLLGKYLAYLAMGGLVAAALATAATYGLGVPMLGGPRQYALVVGGLLFASLGVGFVISLISQNENQAVQYAMLVLLTGVFFSGFLVILTAITKPIRYISWAMPGDLRHRTPSERDVPRADHPVGVRGRVVRFGRRLDVRRVALVAPPNGGAMTACARMRARNERYGR